MSDSCFCCAGTEIAVPQSEINPPGLAALTYRVGTYATFYETMLASLTGLVLEVPSAGSGTENVSPLALLTTRDPSDPSIALLDAWAVVADVLTFYQERIANEGYLPTAIERRSLLELARLIGYRLRPGVSASVKLAFTVANGFTGTLPLGTRAQSIPGTGQSPQFFETSASLDVRDAWNALQPRLARPQLITPADKADGLPLITGADVIDSVYFDGVTTGLSAGDALLFVFGPATGATPAQQYLRFAATIDMQASQSRTEVTLALAPQTLGLTISELLNLYLTKASFLFPASDIASQVVNVLKLAIGNLGAGVSEADVLQAPRARIALLQGVAAGRGFTRVAAWLTNLLQVLQLGIAGFLPGAYRYPGPGGLTVLPPTVPASPLAGLGEIIGKLAQPPSRQPAGPLQLPRSVAASYAPQSDIAPRLLAALRPAASSSLYAAWSALATPAGTVEVYAARQKAGLFAGAWVGHSEAASVRSDPAGATALVEPITATRFTEPTIATAWARAVPGGVDGGIGELPLDATYAQIKPGSWVAIARPLGADGATTFHTVVSVRTGSVATAPLQGFAAKVTLLTLQPPFLSDLSTVPTGEGVSPYAKAIGNAEVLRGTVVYAQCESLTVVDEPLDTDIAGGSIDLDQVYDGIEPGRWIIVSGTRTDIPNVSGVTAAELAMVAGVLQGEDAPLCASASFTSPPFSKIYYTTDANAYGDRLVVGKLAPQPEAFQHFLDSLPQPLVLNQQYCNQVELAPGFFANAYVPTNAERRGEFSAFAGLLLVNPLTKEPIRDGFLSPKEGVFAWRVSSQALHTTLNLASPLAYSYDRGSITIFGNVADATHGQSTGEVLGNGNAAQPWLTFALSQTPLTYVSAPTASGAASSLAVRVNELHWTGIDNFAEAPPRQRAYITRENTAQVSSVTFGNGVFGARTPTGTANVKATYRYGIGSPGNVDAGQISQLATHPLGAQSVINPLPASGGVDADTVGQARANAPISVTALDRLVSVSDYADFANSFAGIGKATSIRLSDGRMLTVHVTIAGADDSPILAGDDLFNNLLTALQTYGDPYQPVQLAVRRVRLLVLAASVALQPAYDWTDVAPNLRAAVLALFAFDARALGQAAFQSEAVAALQAVAGVAWVNVTTFDSVPESITASQLASLAKTLRARPFVASELASIDPAAAPGTAGRIVPAELVFMTPDIADTLILTQAGT